MRKQVRNWVSGLTWAQRFLLVSLVILVAGMGAIGAWIASQIEKNVVQEAAETAAVYVDSAVAPSLQNLATGDEIGAQGRQQLDELFRTTRLGEQIPSFKVWTRSGRAVYTTSSDIVGETFPIEGGLARALQGKVDASISPLDEAENVSERARGKPLLEIYSPVRRAGSDEIIAVAEFYQLVEDLQQNLATTVRQTWLFVGAVTVGMYLLLAGFVRVASSTIARQETELNAQVKRLQDVLKKNAELGERVRRAAAQTTALNERFLRRISAELHDGPAQDLGLALLKLDHVMARSEAQAEQDGGREQARLDDQDLNAVKQSLDHALQETRAISAGMGVPQLNNLTPEEIVARVVRTHERRTGTQVKVETQGLPAHASLPIKITAYRVMQEALNNAYRHAQGIGQGVRVRGQANELTIEITDEGHGTNGDGQGDEGEHLGVIGMRERVESLGGTFEWESSPRGTRVAAHLPLQDKE